MAAEKLLVSGVTELLKILVPVVSGQINEAWGAHKGLEKLKGTLETIAAVTIDAEEQQEKSELVKLWLEKLNDVVYDADDVLDEISYETMRQLEMGGKKNKVPQLFSSCTSVAFKCKMSWKMSRKIKKINTRLDYISTEMKKYHFSLTPHVNTYDHNTVLQNRKIATFVLESSVLGRDNDKSIIINMLNAVQESSSKFSVVSVVGMGGLGKTTLARLVYEDDLVRRSFDKTAWVCVSDDFNIQKILINIIGSFTNKECADFSNVEVLVDKVREELSNKKYLVVLDDLWNEDAEEWSTLQRLLCVGAQGSKVLITTRSNKVADIVGDAISPYILGKLPDSVCWSIIKTKAFSPGGAIETPNLICIGKKVAESCGGLPLAANVLGNVLRLHKTETDWRSILDHDSLRTFDARNRITPILKLSYDKLPSHLKLCFSYCSLFPKDWVIDRKILVRLWMAEGFLHPSQGGNQISLEDVGDDYFHSLLANSFFQDVKLDMLGDVATCKMHALVHDLAQSVSGVHDIKIINSGEMDSFFKHRRLLLNVYKQTSDTFSEVLKKSKRPRSIFSLQNCYLGEHLLYGKNLRVVSLHSVFNLGVHSSIVKHKHLRYLDLSFCSFDEGQDMSINQLYNLQTLVLHECKNVEMILAGIGSLKVLRHLDLSWSDVLEFDDSVVQLTNLQVLDLSGCKSLEALPENIGSLKDLRELSLCICWRLKVLPREVGNLTQLRCLDLSGTDMKVSLCISNLGNLELLHFGGCELPREIKDLPKLRIFRLQERKNEYKMPRGIETLIGLEVLDCYVVRNTSSSGGGSGIEELADLNSLRELKIINLELVRGGIDAERAKLKDKTNLRKLSLNWGSDDHDDAMAFDKVLEGLEPNPNLRKLEVIDFPGLKFPKWTGSSNCLPNLVEIKLEGYNNCEKLPALGMLPCLRDLDISGMNSVTRLGEEFYCHLEEKESSGGAADATTVSLFPSLISLTLGRMRNLEEWVALPAIYNLFPSLENLLIEACPKLRSTPKSFSFLKDMRLYGIVNSNAINSIFAAGGLTSLTSIDISNSPQLIYIPLGVLLQNIAPNLQRLSIKHCPKFKGFVEYVDLNNNNKDGDYDEETTCPEVNSNSNNRSSSLRSLYFENCPVLTLLPDLRSFTSLRELTIYRCSKLKESIPYDLKTLIFLEKLWLDFIQSEYENPEDSADEQTGIFSQCKKMKGWHVSKKNQEDP